MSEVNVDAMSMVKAILPLQRWLDAYDQEIKQAYSQLTTDEDYLAYGKEVDRANALRDGLNGLVSLVAPDGGPLFEPFDVSEVHYSLYKVLASTGVSMRPGVQPALASITVPAETVEPDEELELEPEAAYDASSVDDEDFVVDEADVIDEDEVADDIVDIEGEIVDTPTKVESTDYAYADPMAVDGDFDVEQAANVDDESDALISSIIGSDEEVDTTNETLSFIDQMYEEATKIVDEENLEGSYDSVDAFDADAYNATHKPSHEFEEKVADSGEFGSGKTI